MKSIGSGIPRKVSVFGIRYRIVFTHTASKGNKIWEQGRVGRLFADASTYTPIGRLYAYMLW